MIDDKNVQLTGPVSVLAKNENGYYTSNSIFDGVENISSRFDLKPSKGKIFYFFGFSLSDRQKLIYMSLRVEEKTNDYRNSKHCDLYYITLDKKAGYNKAVPYLIKAICRKTSSFCTNEIDLIEAMLYIRDYIPDRLVEGIVLSFNASDSDNVIFLSDRQDHIAIEEYYRHYARFPHLYFERFKHNIDTLYSKGYYKDGPSESLRGAVSVIDRQIKAKQLAERRRKEAEEQQRKALLEAERKRKQLEEFTRQEEERLERERIAKKEEERKRMEAIRALTKNEMNSQMKTGVSAKDIHAHNDELLFDAYPYSSSYLLNPLHIHSLISYYSGRIDAMRARDAWEISSLKQIVEYYEQICRGKEQLIIYAEPTTGCCYYPFYKALRNYLLEDKKNSGLFMSLLFWFNKAEISDFSYFGLDYKSSLKTFSRLALYREYTDHDSLLERIEKYFQHCRIDCRISKMIRRSKRKLKRKG